MILDAINTTAPTGVWTLVTLPADQDCEDYAVQARDAFDVLISASSVGTTYWTIKSGTAISLAEVLGPGAAFFYAKSIGTQTIVEVQPLRRYRGR